MDWMLMPYRRYFDFEGRSQRKEYWMFALFTILVAVVLCVLMFSGGFPLNGDSESPGMMFWLGAALLGVFWLAKIIPSIAVQVRRFHDQDRSGWMVLIALVPYVGGLIVLVFMCLEGTRGPNRFGPDPKGAGSAEVFS